MNVVSSEVNRYNPRPLSYEGGRGFGIRYPSPFFDVGQQFLPANVSQLHKWCRYYFMTNPIINVACSKMAEYPVTPLLYETEDSKVQSLYKGLEKQLKLREFQVEVGLDYFVYGNAFVSIFYPLIKYLECSKCKERVRVDKSRNKYKWHNMKFKLSCPRCNHEGYATEHDQYIKSVRDIRLVRWNPENISLKYNEITGHTQYYFKLPRSVINDIKIGDKDTIESIPKEFLDAARKSKALLFNPDNIYHLKRPTIAQKDQGWGTPLILPLLKDAFYLQVMKKAQESILMEHIIPLRMIFPGPNTGGNEGPYGSFNLSNWKKKVDAEINTWKRDHNYIPVLPMNIGFQQVGGQGKMLMLFQEMRMLAEQMLAGAGIPVEFVFGGLQWSGSSTSLRALENMFLGYNKQRHELVNDFVVKKIAAFMKWPVVETRFEKFKMADDLQRAMFYMQLNQAQKISDRRLLEEISENFELEHKRMDEELLRQLQVQRKMQMASADVQGEASLKSSRYQAKAQELQMKAQMKAQMEMQKEQEAQQAPAQQEQQAQMQQMQAQLQQQQQAQQQDAAQDQNAIKQQVEQQLQAKEIAKQTEKNKDKAQQTPGLPEGATAYDENAEKPNEANIPASMASPLEQGAGGIDLRYIAQRAVSYLRTVKNEQGADAMYQELSSIQTSNPQLYQLVVQLLNGDQGSQSNPNNPGTAAGPSSPRQV